MTLASFFSWADRFESYLVENPEDRFSCDEAHLCDWVHLCKWNVVLASMTLPTMPKIWFKESMGSLEAAIQFPNIEKKNIMIAIQMQ